MIADSCVHETQIIHGFEVGLGVFAGESFLVRSLGAQLLERRGIGSGVEGRLVVHVRFAVEDAGGLEPIPACKEGPVADLGEDLLLSVN